MLQTVGCTSGGGYTPFNTQYNPDKEQGQQEGSMNIPSREQSGNWANNNNNNNNNAFPGSNNGQQEQGNNYNYGWNSGPTIIPPYKPNRSNNGNTMQAEISAMMLGMIINLLFVSMLVF